MQTRFVADTRYMNCLTNTQRCSQCLTSPVASATKLSTVLGTVFPKTPMTILPTSSSPILMSKKTYKRSQVIKLFTLQFLPWKGKNTLFYFTISYILKEYIHYFSFMSLLDNVQKYSFSLLLKSICIYKYFYKLFSQFISLSILNSKHLSFVLWHYYNNTRNFQSFK